MKKQFMEKRAWFFHLLNDFSGSPNVLAQVVQIVKDEGYQVKITTTQGKGFLSDIEGVQYSHYQYKWSPYKLVTLCKLFFVQWKLFWKVLLAKNVKGSVIYINTLLPFGPALAGRLKGARVVYHIHESYIKPKLFRNFLVGVAAISAQKVIMVSRYLYDEYPALQNKAVIVNNALPKTFIHQVVEKLEDEQPFTVLMLASLKRYKGVDEFVKVAQQLKEINFELVLNASLEEVKTYFKQLPTNLKVFPAQADVHSFYQRASLVMNLTIPELCKESFGMTILEAKAYGIPSIVPPAGGPKELVVNGKDGYLIHPQNLPMQSYVIEEIARNKHLLARLKDNAALSLDEFSYPKFKEKISSLVS